MFAPELKKELDDLHRRVSWLEKELESAIIRIRSETDKTIKDMLHGIESHVVNVIARELKETRNQLAKIDQILAWQEKASEWQATIKRVEIREEAEKMHVQMTAAEDALFAQRLELATKVADLQVKKTGIDTSIDTRIDGRHKRRMAVWALIISLATLAISGGACSALSHLTK